MKLRVENAGFKPLLLLRHEDHENSAVLPSCSALTLISLPRPTGMGANENFRGPQSTQTEGITRPTIYPELFISQSWDGSRAWEQ